MHEYQYYIFYKILHSNGCEGVADVLFKSKSGPTQNVIIENSIYNRYISAIALTHDCDLSDVFIVNDTMTYIGYSSEE